MTTEPHWSQLFWEWCKRLIPGDQNYRDYVQVEEIGDDCISITFYSKEERFQLAAGPPSPNIEEGVLELIMTDNVKPLRGEMYIQSKEMLGHLEGPFTEEYFNFLLTHLHKVGFFSRPRFRFVRLSDLDSIRKTWGYRFGRTRR